MKIRYALVSTASLAFNARVDVLKGLSVPEPSHAGYGLAWTDDAWHSRENLEAGRSTAGRAGDHIGAQ